VRQLVRTYGFFDDLQAYMLVADCYLVTNQTNRAPHGCLFENLGGWPRHLSNHEHNVTLAELMSSMKYVHAPQEAISKLRWLVPKSFYEY
jgi:hypothetical protein